LARADLRRSYLISTHFKDEEEETPVAESRDVGRDAVRSPLDAYYAALDGGDVDATVATFADDAVYIRPTLPPAEPGLEVIRGRDALRDFFVARGKQPHRHEVRACAVDGPRCFVEGVAGVEGEPPTHIFLVHATLDAGGLIERYFALMAETPGNV
jgi:ketosteroid isomerase-like protein